MLDAWSWLHLVLKGPALAGSPERTRPNWIFLSWLSSHERNIQLGLVLVLVHQGDWSPLAESTEGTTSGWTQPAPKTPSVDPASARLLSGFIKRRLDPPKRSNLARLNTKVASDGFIYYKGTSDGFYNISSRQTLIIFQPPIVFLPDGTTGHIEGDTWFHGEAKKATV